jgi:hypothetical protein
LSKISEMVRKFRSEKTRDLLYCTYDIQYWMNSAAPLVKSTKGAHLLAFSRSQLLCPVACALATISVHPLPGLTLPSHTYPCLLLQGAKVRPPASRKEQKSVHTLVNPTIWSTNQPAVFKLRKPQSCSKVDNATPSLYPL